MYRPAYNVRGSEALLAKAWLFWRRAWPTGWTGCFAIVDSMDGVAAVWCASRGMSVPPLVYVVAAALAEGFTLSRPVTVAGVVVGRFAWRPSLFSWCASMALSMFCSLFLGFVWPRVIPFSWPASRLAVKTIHAEWSKLLWECPTLVGEVAPWLAPVGACFVANQWLLALSRDIPWPARACSDVLGSLAVAEGAPPACDLGLVRPWCVRPLCAGCFRNTQWVFVWWLLDGFAPTALLCRMAALA
ncbi:hypothetical protein V6N11_061103 [Hibiscus sabdariffa]|uniref:Uncharacterized protein n=1 Tax=Hibiscus sabdariffa TaxID=183260 RepID=A0ABR2PIX6_9ROSI